MPIGRVKLFDDEKGFGFITLQGFPEDVFVHHSEIRMDGYRTLPPGQAVEFEIKIENRRFKAVNVRPCGADAARSTA